MRRPTHVFTTKRSWPTSSTHELFWFRIPYAVWLDIVKPNFEAGWSLGLDQDTQTRPHVKRRLRFRSRVFFQIVRSAKIYARSGWFVNLKQSIFLAEVSLLSPKVAALEMAFLDPELTPISNLAAIKVMRYAS